METIACHVCAVKSKSHCNVNMVVEIREWKGENHYFLHTFLNNNVIMIRQSMRSGGHFESLG